MISKPKMQRNILITGGAGFIGSNLAQRLLATADTRVRIFDDLSRPGVEHNLTWLQRVPGSERLEFLRGDVQNASHVTAAVKGVTEIYHLAAQVAVTTSIDQPRHDLEVNVLGTFNVLEAARLSPRRPFLLFTSTNKVYGGLQRVPVAVAGTRYRAKDSAFLGVDESEALDFHSPYGCSKGAADQYVRDYARIYGLAAVVFRMSCIAGQRQFGTEDQGWVAHFLYSVLDGKPITVYGDGFQVRDILHVDDLVDAMQAVYLARARTAGNVYNVGGGIERAISVIEMLRLISQQTGVEPILHFDKLRPGDQPLYISDTTRISAHTGWRPARSCVQTLASIHQFWRTHHDLFYSQRSGVSAPQEVGAEALA